jgi:hypothetical protein
MAAVTYRFQTDGTYDVFALRLSVEAFVACCRTDGLTAVATEFAELPDPPPDGVTPPYIEVIVTEPPPVYADFAEQVEGHADASCIAGVTAAVVED